MKRIYLSGINKREVIDCKNIVNRFMSKVLKDSVTGCWNWNGGKDRKGYGKFSIGGSRNKDGTRRNSMVTATRVSYEIFIGEIPAGDGYHGTCVLHHCDNPCCVNPEHLFLGSNKDNVLDMDKKGRRVNKQPKGEMHGTAKLTVNQVDSIVIQLNKKVPQHLIAKEFGVCLATVNHIAKGRLWSHHTGIKK